jgi:hypothetical protein
VAVVRLVLRTTSVLDIVAVALLALHDAVDGAGRSVLAIVFHAASQLPLFTLAVALVDVAANIVNTFVLVEIGVQVAVFCVVHLRLVGVVLIDLLLDGGGEVAPRWLIRSAA